MHEWNLLKKITEKKIAFLKEEFFALNQGYRTRKTFDIKK
jgi:hypothetical protein